MTPREVRDWWFRYRVAQRTLDGLTTIELGRCMVRHARGCELGCDFVLYDSETGEADLVVELAGCVVGTVLYDELERRALELGTGGSP